MNKDVLCIYIHTILLSHKKEIMPFAATWMDLHLDYYTKGSKSER